MNRDVALWTGIFAGPVVWLLSFEANFALAPWACEFQNKLALFIVTLLGLILVASAGLLAWREWSQLGRELPGDHEGAISRTRVMAIGGVLMSIMFFLVILAQAIPEVILKACD